MINGLNYAGIFLDLKKTDYKLLLCINLLYEEQLKNPEPKEYKLGELEEFTCLSGMQIISSINSLERKNILYRYEFNIMNTNISNSVSESITNKNKEFQDKAKNAHFFISDGQVYYVLSTDVTLWKYPSRRKINKSVNSISKKIYNNTNTKLNKIIQDLKEGKNIDKGIINGWDVHSVLSVFMSKFMAEYKVSYPINFQIDYCTMRSILQYLHENKVKTEELDEVLNYSFKRQEEANWDHLSIYKFKYWSTAYLSNKKKEEKPQVQSSLAEFAQMNNI